MLWLLVAVPAVAGLLAFAMPCEPAAPCVAGRNRSAHAGLVAIIFARPPAPYYMAGSRWTRLRLIPGDNQFHFSHNRILRCRVPGSRRTPHRERPDDELPFANYPEATFTGCCLLFLAAMTLVVVSQHWGLMWVAVEATTLASAPLIYFHRSPKSLEATWKYLVICSVGIALAFWATSF